MPSRGGRSLTVLVLTGDPICYTSDSNIQLIVLNVDFEKAFDRVPHQYLFPVLQKKGSPERFIPWVGLLHSKFVVNGHTIKAAETNCSGRQGFPLSLLLYVV